MSVWKLYEGVRYCAGVNEHTLKRYKRIRENREKLVELGLATSDEPLDCYQSSEWKEHTVAYSEYETLLKQFKEGKIELEMTVEDDPEGDTSKLENNRDKDSPVVNINTESPKKMKKKTKQSKNKKKEYNIRKVKEEQVEHTDIVGVKTSYQTENTETEGPEVDELEMFLQSIPGSVDALQDLFVHKNLTSHVTDGPVDIVKLIAENPKLTHEILEANIDSILPDEDFLSYLKLEYAGGLEEFLEKNQGKKLPEVRIQPPEGLFDSGDFNEETSKDDEEEEQYKFGRILRDPTDKCYKKVEELYNNFQDMTNAEYYEKVRQELQALNTIEVIDDKEESTEQFNPDKTEHSRSLQSVPNINISSCTDVDYQKPSCSKFTAIFTSSDKSDSNVLTSTSETIHNTDCTSTSETILNTECTSSSETIHSTDCTSASETIHNTECTGSDVSYKEKLPTVSSNQELYDKSDKISRSSNWLPEIVPEKEKDQDIDDFEYLGNLDDGYLLSLFEEEEERIPSCTDLETISKVNSTVTVNQVVEQAGSSANTLTSGLKLNETYTDEVGVSPLPLNNAATNTRENSRRYNPPRRAKDGVEYCENNDYLENVLQSEYFCWQCKDNVRDVCVLHGPLLPCLPDISVPPSKNKSKFSVPSFIEIKESTIPGAGHGAFTKQFIEPGRILGDYAGKMITEKEYKKLEREQKESGYAWKAVSQDGGVIYLDGADKRCSNWLRFVNCARGRCEENVLVRNIPGGVQYYTYKPIAIGTELLVFYGDGYFEELGYSLSTDSEINVQFHCTVCYKLFTTQTLLDTHTCGKTLRVSGKEKKHKCDTCGKMFVERGTLTKHIRTVHLKITRFSCPYCKYRTDLKHDLTKHLATHTGDKMYRCTQCDYSAAQKIQLTTHIYNNHTNKTYKCRYMKCDVKKSSVQELHEHIRTEHPVQQHMCDVCPMSFKEAHHLTRHKLTHSERDSKYECKYCGKQFGSSQHLKVHSRIHTGEKPHKCSECGRGFNLSGDLTKHMRIHTGERPFSCSYCDRRFTVSSNRTKHVIKCKSRTPKK